MNFTQIIGQNSSVWGFLGHLLVKNLPAMWDPRFGPWVRKIPLEEGMAIHSSILAMDRGAWGATVCGVSKSWTGLSN